VAALYETTNTVCKGVQTRMSPLVEIVDGFWMPFFILVTYSIP